MSQAWRETGLLKEIVPDQLLRAAVLEWFANKIWVGLEEGSGFPDYGGKSYDPLTIEMRTDGGGIAHSYVFNFHDGGRHHSFDSLDNLEEWLLEELINGVHHQQHEWEDDDGSDPSQEG